MMVKRDWFRDDFVWDDDRMDFAPREADPATVPSSDSTFLGCTLQEMGPGTDERVEATGSASMSEEAAGIESGSGHMVDSGMQSEIQPGVSPTVADRESSTTSDRESVSMTNRIAEDGVDSGMQSAKEVIDVANTIGGAVVEPMTESGEGSMLLPTHMMGEMVGRQSQAPDPGTAPTLLAQNQPQQMGPTQNPVAGHTAVLWSCDQCVRSDSRCNGDSSGCKRCKNARVRCVYAENAVDVYALLSEVQPAEVEAEIMGFICRTCRGYVGTCDRTSTGCSRCVERGLECVYKRRRDCDRCISLRVDCSKDARGCERCIEGQARCLYTGHLLRFVRS